jgi:hypothetical protein
MTPAPIHAVERTASQPAALVGEGGVRGGWLAVAHFLRSAAAEPKACHGTSR